MLKNNKMKSTLRIYLIASLILVIIIYKGNNLKTLSAKGSNAVQGSKKFKNEVIRSGNYSLVEKKLDKLKMKKYKADELRIIRNTIFAKYGYIFRSKDLNIHFKKFIWYKPNSGNTRQIKRGKILTKVELYNIYTLKGIEDEIKKTRMGKPVANGSDPCDWWNGDWNCTNGERVSLSKNKYGDYIIRNENYNYHKPSKKFVFCVQASGGKPYCVEIRFKDKNTFIVAVGEGRKKKDTNRCRRE